LLASLVLGCSSTGLPSPESPAPTEEAPRTDQSPPGEAAPEPPPQAPQPFEPLLPSLPPAADLAPPAPDPNAPADLQKPPAARTPSGLRSRILQPGTGTEHPGPEDTVAVRYTGWTPNGVRFDSTGDAGETAEMVLSRAIRGWREGLPLMVAGEKRRFWVPGELAYGDTPGRSGKPPGPVVFDMELVSFQRKPVPPPVPADLQTPPATARKTPSGLAYQVLEKGSGKVHPRPHSVVQVHYSGWTADGTMFDSSLARGQPSSFPLGNVIRGWREGLQLMVVGEKARFWIPAPLAYGANPPSGTPAGPLVFDVELIDIKEP
jgi:peptidylprolyl isomerase